MADIVSIVSRPHIGALLMGYYTDDGRLLYAGRAGSGMTDKDLKRLAGVLMPRRPSTRAARAPLETLILAMSDAKATGLDSAVVAVAFAKMDWQEIARCPFGPESGSNPHDDELRQLTGEAERRADVGLTEQNINAWRRQWHKI